MSQWIEKQGATLSVRRSLRTPNSFNLLSIHTPNLKEHVPTLADWYSFALKFSRSDISFYQKDEKFDNQRFTADQWITKYKQDAVIIEKGAKFLRGASSVHKMNQKRSIILPRAPLVFNSTSTISSTIAASSMASSKSLNIAPRGLRVLRKTSVQVLHRRTSSPISTLDLVDHQVQAQRSQKKRVNGLFSFPVNNSDTSQGRVISNSR